MILTVNRCCASGVDPPSDAEGFAVQNDANVDVFGTGRQWQRVSTGGFGMWAITMEAASSPPGV